MPLKGNTLKPVEERREIILEALKILRGDSREFASIQELAEDHGMTRQGVHAYFDWALDDPEGRLRQAEEEVEFRREVVKLVRGRANRSRHQTGRSSRR